MTGAEAVDRPPLLGNWLTLLEERLEKAGGLTLCLDFDGTLAPIVEEPDEASMPKRTREAVAALTDRPAFDVAVVSGRGLSDLRERVGVEGCALAGNHGLEIDRGESTWVHPEVEEYRDALDRICATAERHVEPIPGCRIEDKDLTATVHYREADVDSGTILPLVDSILEDEPGFETIEGRQIVEIRPTIDWNKGDAVRTLADGESMTVYVGDDTTDEDAFRALETLSCPTAGVLVGDRPSAATFRVHDVDGVRAFLEWLARVETSGPTAREEFRDGDTTRP